MMTQLSYKTIPGDHKDIIVSGTDMADLDTYIAYQVFEQTVKLLCDKSEAPGDDFDRLAQQVSFYGEGALAYLKIAVTQLCQDSAP